MIAYPQKPSEYPDQTLNIQQPTPATGKFVLLGVYPNPFHDAFAIQYYLFEKQQITISMEDLNGKLIYTAPAGETEDGLHYFSVADLAIPEGPYILSVRSSSGNVRQMKVIKVK